MVPKNQTLTPRRRFFIGGLGALAPILLNLLVIDLETLLLDLTILAVLSYLIRATALFAAGGGIALLNKGETDLLRIFQLGITAPALLTTAINGSHVTLPQNPDRPSTTSSLTTGSAEKPGILSFVYAQPQEAERSEIKQFSLPKETPVDQIFRGLLGSTPENVWFVIAGSYRDRKKAEKQVGPIRDKGFSADVYAPYGDNPYYAVVIGAQLARSEAEQLRLKAIKEGLRSDTYLWTFPRQ